MAVYLSIAKLTDSGLGLFLIIGIELSDWRSSSHKDSIQKIV